MRQLIIIAVIALLSIPRIHAQENGSGRPPMSPPI